MIQKAYEGKVIIPRQNNVNIFSKLNILSLKERIISRYPNWNEEKVNDLTSYIQERLSDLKVIKLDECPDYIFFSKTNDRKDIIFEYELKTKYINTFYKTFSSKILNHYNIKPSDYNFIVLNSLIETSKLKGEYIVSIYVEYPKNLSKSVI